MQQTMTTYLIRDALKEKITRAIGELNDANIDLRIPMETQLEQLQKEDWSVTDHTFETVGADQLWANFANIEAILKENPAKIALNDNPLLTPAQLSAIKEASMPHSNIPPFDYLDKIKIALDNDPLLLNELLFVMYHLWFSMGMENNSYPYDDVAVLLPVRIETLFRK